MFVETLWKRAAASIVRSINSFCAARDVHRGTAWERLSVAYPEPREALTALTRLKSAGLELPATC